MLVVVVKVVYVQHYRSPRLDVFITCVPTDKLGWSGTRFLALGVDGCDDPDSELSLVTKLPSTPDLEAEGVGEHEKVGEDADRLPCEVIDEGEVPAVAIGIVGIFLSDWRDFFLDDALLWDLLPDECLCLNTGEAVDV